MKTICYVILLKKTFLLSNFNPSLLLSTILLLFFQLLKESVILVRVPIPRRKYSRCWLGLSVIIVRRLPLPFPHLVYLRIFCLTLIDFQMYHHFWRWNLTLTQFVKSWKKKRNVVSMFQIKNINFGPNPHGNIVKMMKKISSLILSKNSSKLVLMLRLRLNNFRIGLNIMTRDLYTFLTALFGRNIYVEYTSL